MRTCTKCLRTLRHACFYRQRAGDGYRAACKECHAAAERARREKGGDELRARRASGMRERRRSDPEYRLRGQLAPFGITPDDYRKMVAEQDSVCAICGRPELDRRNHRLAVDHCHENGHVRGLLCKACNIGIGMFNDDTDRLQRAIDYLRETTP